jgi:Glycosyl hydrolase family 81 C-terminal domain
MIDLLVRDIATGARDDAKFPFVRHFDVYAGHSWATGRQQYVDGANAESSSEAIAAWAAVLLWGRSPATGHCAISAPTSTRPRSTRRRSTGSTSTSRTFRPSTGSRWSDRCGAEELVQHLVDRRSRGDARHQPRPAHDHIPLPRTPPRLCSRRPPPTPRSVVVLAGHLLGLRSPRRSCSRTRTLRERRPDYTEGHSESRPHTLSWILDLVTLGEVDDEIGADTALYAVFRKSATRTYIAFNACEAPRTVTFSDGVTVDVEARSALAASFENVGIASSSLVPSGPITSSTRRCSVPRDESVQAEKR